MHTNDKLASAVSPAMPEAVNVYDMAAGKYHDRVCDTPPAPAIMHLPGTPMPFANLKSGK